MTEEENPYQSPDSLEQAPALVQRQTNVLRGLAFAILFSAIGFVLPLISRFLAEVLLGAFNYSPRYDIIIMFKRSFASAIGCAILFGLAAILNFTPAKKLGMIRSLLVVGIVSILGIVVISSFFGIDTRYRGVPDPWKWLRLTIVIMIPSLFTLCFTILRSRKISTVN